MHFRLSPSVKVLCIAFIGVFLIVQTGDQFAGTSLTKYLALTPSDFVLHFRFWQIFTYIFLHADVMHLFLNMLMLVFIGSELEVLWGRKRFLRFFFLCAMSGGILYLAMNLFVYRAAGIHTPMVGASGGIYGLLVAYGILFSERQLLFMLIFPMKAKHFVLVLAGIELMTSLFSGHGGAMGTLAHLGGMAAGFILLWGEARMRIRSRSKKSLWNDMTGNMQQKLKKKKRKNHLKLVINNEEDDNDDKTWH